MYDMYMYQMSTCTYACLNIEVSFIWTLFLVSQNQSKLNFSQYT